MNERSCGHSAISGTKTSKSSTPTSGTRNGSGEHATALFEGVRAFQDWGVSDLEAYTWFMTDVEWSWMSGRTPIEDW